MLRPDDATPRPVRYPRNTDLDPQLVWRGKDEQDWSDLVVYAPPLYIQEKVHPKVLIDDLLRQTKEAQTEPSGVQANLFSDFNGIPEGVDRTEFYQHDQNWSNRMILGDSLQVMASLAEREGLRGKVQCIYLDPPYGIKFNSSFQWSTTSRDVKDGKADHITREPEQVKAFRDTWRDGVHSYLTYLRDRLTVARDLLTESGSIFMQIGDENMHRVRALMDEVFGEENFIVQIGLQKTGGLAGKFLESTQDYILWYSRRKDSLKFRGLFTEREAGHASLDRYDQHESTMFTAEPVRRASTVIQLMKRFQLAPLYSDGESSAGRQPVTFQGNEYSTRSGTHWKTRLEGNVRIIKANRIKRMGTTIRYKRFVGDLRVIPITERWESSWRALGVDIRGRSKTLRVNYRTSHQIRVQADRLLGPEVSDADGNREERRHTVSVFNGPAPEIRVLRSQEEEVEHVGQWVSGRAKDGVAPHEFGVFVRSAAELDRARLAVQLSELPFKILDENVETSRGHISISTMHLSKGLEFRAVVVMACDDEIIPLQERIETVVDAADLQEVYDTERHLLYVACTRARDHLLVTSGAPASEFLDDMERRGIASHICESV